MQHRMIGQTDLSVSAIGLGCNNFGIFIDDEKSIPVIHKALDCGINFFDTADVYADSEALLGKVLGDRRKEVVIATKFGMAAAAHPDAGTRNFVHRCAETSLKRLQTDYIDLFYLHAPDPSQKIDETLRGMEELVTEGKVRHIGCSNMTAGLLMEARLRADADGTPGFCVTEEEYSVLERRVEKDITAVLSRLGMSLIPYFPLASGLLTGKYQRNSAIGQDSRLAKIKEFTAALVTEENFNRIEQLTVFAEERGKSLIELAFAWILANELVPSVIAGASKPEQIIANVEAANWKLTPEEFAEVDRIAPI